MDDASRRALRDLARRAEWRGHAGAAGAAQDADALRELGARLRAALLREPDQDASAWGYQAAERLSAYCLKARADWTPEQVAELARLREDAVIALAPGPGESDVLPPRGGRGLPGLPNLASRQARLVALVTAGCVVLVVLLLLLPHFLSSDNSAEPVASATTSAAPADTTPPTTTTDTTAPTTSPSLSTSASTSTSAAAPTTSAAGSTTTTSATGPTSRVTAIQITNTDNVPGNPPEVILTYTVTTSGTGDALLYITVNGSVPTALASMEPIDESGQTTYSDLTQTIDLSQWCGKTVKVAITSGSVSQSVSVPVSGC